jgi:hypothetical protein
MACTVEVPSRIVANKPIHERLDASLNKRMADAMSTEKRVKEK